MCRRNSGKIFREINRKVLISARKLKHNYESEKNYKAYEEKNTSSRRLIYCYMFLSGRFGEE
ncbi:hypothetical protein CRS_32910 [Chryseobacterium sp. ON_d1]|nr:hypothetical protein CRS_32910 [Chryseobacterium sp. ON_d1]